MGVGFAHNDCPRRLEQANAAGIGVRDVVVKHGRTGRYGHAGDVKQVLDGNGNPMECAAADAGRSSRIQLLRQQLQLRRRCHVNKGVERGLPAIDGGEHLVQERRCGERALAQGLARTGERQRLAAKRRNQRTPAVQVR